MFFFTLIMFTKLWGWVISCLLEGGLLLMKQVSRGNLLLMQGLPKLVCCPFFCLFSTYSKVCDSIFDNNLMYLFHKFFSLHLGVLWGVNIFVECSWMDPLVPTWCIPINMDIILKFGLFSCFKSMDRSIHTLMKNPNPIQDMWIFSDYLNVMLLKYK